MESVLLHTNLKKRTSIASQMAFGSQEFIGSVPLTIHESSSGDSNSAHTGLSDTKITANELYSLSNLIIHKKSSYFSTNILPLLKHIEQNSVNKVAQHNEGLKASKLTLETKKEMFLLTVRANKCLTSSKEHEAQLILTRTGTPTNRRESRKESRDTQSVTTKIQKMLNTTPRQIEDWTNEIEAMTQVERWIEITVEEASGLFQAEGAGLERAEQPNPFCKFGLMAQHEAFANNKKSKATNWDACDSICITNAKQTTNNPKWRDSFKIPLFPNRNLIVMEVWDQQSPNLEQSRRRRGKCIMVRSKKKDIGSQYIGRCTFDVSNVGGEKESQTAKLLSHSGKSIRGSLQVSTQVITTSHDDALEQLKKGDHGLELFQLILTEWGRSQLASGKTSLDNALPDSLLVLLKKIAELLGLSHFQQSLAFWPYYTDYLVQHSNNREQLTSSLFTISSLWEEEGQRLSQAQLNSFKNSLMKIYNHDLALIERARVLFPPNNQAAVHSLTNITKCLQQIFKFLKKLEMIGEEVDFKAELLARVEKDVTDWFSTVLSNAQPKFASNDELDQSSSLADVLQVLAQDLADSLKFYPNAFGKLGINYFETSLIIYDREINNAIKEYFNSYDLNSYFGENNDYEDDLDDVCERTQCSLSLFRLYIGIRNLVAFKQFSSDTNIELSLEKYHSLFKQFVRTWIDSLRYLTHIHTETISLETEVQTYQELNIKISVSALEILQIFEHCHDFYEKIQWPYIEDSFNFAVRVTEIIRDSAKLYVHYERERIKNETQRMLTKGGGFEVCEDLCLALNNCQYVIHYLEQARSLEKWTRLTDCFPLQASSFIETIEGLYDESIREVKAFMRQMIESLAFAFQKQFKQYFVGFMAKPDVIEIKKAIYDQQNWLENNIASTKVHLPNTIAPLMIEQMWMSVLRVIMPYREDVTKCERQYSKMFDAIGILFELFSSKGQLPRDTLCSYEYNLIYDYFKLHTISTTKLIRAYCKELVQTDRIPTEDLGTLTFSAMYSGKSGKLEVNFIKAAGLNFLEDYQSYKACVKLSVFPEQNHVDSGKTKVFNSGTNPTILQEVSIGIPGEIMNKEGVLLLLSIHSEASKDSAFGGSVYFPLCSVQQFSDASERDKTVKPESLTLPFTLPISSDILTVLHERTNEKAATSFLKKLNKRKLTDKTKGSILRIRNCDSPESIRGDKKGRFLSKLKL
ncbi:BAI1-associated protein 3-like [Oopsacas minuta]|uniref:BAI1-associated protein 3-like n=1 Tax=Oopsacas minuta TaxID=111878 RepID=A0AAV7JNR7_9METZ|nr:BAI1-associated protein 3-like [Oopsacas minuta]